MNSSTATVWQRLSDRTKLPRLLWYPPAPADTYDPELWQKQFDDVSTTIRRSMFGITGYAAFCLIALGQPDAQILKAAAVQLPVVNTSVSVGGFMLIGPLVLVGLTAYLHIFVGHWVVMKSGKSNDGLRPPYIFNLPSRSATAVATFIFYWLPPIVLVSFMYKASPFTDVPILPVAALTTTALLFLGIRRCPDNQRKRRNRLLWLLLLFLLADLVRLWPNNFSLVQIPLYRSYNLSYADLSGAYLRRAKLRDAELVEAYLIGTDLMGANLLEAMLFGANLRDANLSEADLSLANLMRADLRDANLSGADLLYTNLSRADLLKANLRGANLGEADLSWADLSGADLSDASLTYAILRGANLSGADLSGADLSDANLLEANLSGADLRGAENLNCEQLRQANNWETSFRDELLSINNHADSQLNLCE